MLSNRKFNVLLNGEASKNRYLQNGLPQGLVLSLVLFNAYTVDIVETTVRKCIYANDIALVAQTESLDTVQNILNRDLHNLHNYFNKWYLTSNPNKTVALSLHLNNREANRKLNKKINNTVIPNEDCPRYLGIKIDKVLTFKNT